MFDTIYDGIITVFVIIGVYASIWFLYDNLKSFVSIIVALLRPFFQPEEKLTLAERFGNWAGQ